MKGADHGLGSSGDAGPADRLDPGCERSRADGGRGEPPGIADHLHKFVRTQLSLYLQP